MGLRTTSLSVRYTAETPSTPSRSFAAWMRPLRLPSGRSICVTSPVTTILLPSPRRVRNIFICSLVEFCASSRMMKAFERVLPLMYASGAISMAPLSTYFAYESTPSISYRASYRGRRYGSTFSCRSPGRKPSFSPASTAGLVRIIFSTLCCFSSCTARHTARYVLPVPAGPMPKVTSLFLMQSTYRFWPIVLHLMGLPLAVTAMVPEESLSMSPALPSRASSNRYSTLPLSGFSPVSASLRRFSSTVAAAVTPSSLPEITMVVPSSLALTPVSCIMILRFSSKVPRTFWRRSRCPVWTLFTATSAFTILSRHPPGAVQH